MTTDTDTTVTFINVLDVEPTAQQDVIALLQEGTEKVVQHRPGFISVTILGSKDGTKVVNYARWRSADDVRATQADPEAAAYAQRTAALAKAAANLYSVVADYRA